MIPNSSKMDLSILKESFGDQNAEQTTGQAAKSDLPELPNQPDWKTRRKAAPLNKLLGPTLRWAQDLPPEVRPVALMARYPRVANMVAARSKEGSGFHDYLVDLLVDRRGGRKGFSSDIVDEIEHLRAHYFYGGHKVGSGNSIYRDYPEASLDRLGPANRKRS